MAMTLAEYVEMMKPAVAWARLVADLDFRQTHCTPDPFLETARRILEEEWDADDA